MPRRRTPPPPTLYTIGFARSTARDFFTRLREANVTHLIDVRLQNTSQLAGFTKVRDLPFFLEELLGATYDHRLDLAPTREMLAAFRGEETTWEAYADTFRSLLDERDVDWGGVGSGGVGSGGVGSGEAAIAAGPTALLCSEASAEHCHRRLVAEALQQEHPGLQVVHL